MVTVCVVVAAELTNIDHACQVSRCGSVLRLRIPHSHRLPPAASPSPSDLDKADGGLGAVKGGAPSIGWGGG
eukprot:2449351-Rhodomonas_salina.1